MRRWKRLSLSALVGVLALSGSASAIVRSNTWWSSNCEGGGFHNTTFYSGTLGMTYSQRSSNHNSNCWGNVWVRAQYGSGYGSKSASDTDGYVSTSFSNTYFLYSAHTFDPVSGSNFTRTLP